MIAPGKGSGELTTAEYGRNVTVRQLYEYLQEYIPDDAIACIEGKNNIDTFFS